MARHIVDDSMGPDVPLHLSRFYPQYKFSHLPPTPVETLLRAREVARAEGIRYVYVGNVPGKGYEDTRLPEVWKNGDRARRLQVTEWNLERTPLQVLRQPDPYRGG